MRLGLMEPALSDVPLPYGIVARISLRTKGIERAIDRRALACAGFGRHDMEIYESTPSEMSTRSMRTAVALNSAVPDFGSQASIVS